MKQESTGGGHHAQWVEYLILHTKTGSLRSMSGGDATTAATRLKPPPP